MPSASYIAVGGWSLSIPHIDMGSGVVFTVFMELPCMYFVFSAFVEGSNVL